MSFFSMGSKKDRFGVIIDVGSGSVLTAIIHSNSNQPRPTIVWAHREHTSLKKIDSVEQSAKAVQAALMNSSLKLDGEGRSVLREYAPNGKLSALQCSVAAPWSYTVTKTVNLNQDEPIEITEHFIDELVFTAQKQVEEDLKSHSETVDSGLTAITKATMDLLSNGYRVAEPTGEQAKSVNLTQATVVAQQYIVDGLTEVQQKLFPTSPIKAMSFILMLYCTVRALHPHSDDLCLVDVTDEASEIGIVRDGSLRYSTHIPFGMVSIAREISEVANIPLHEALGHLHSPDISGVTAHLPENKHDEISQIFDAYVERLAELFNETGDSLSIPKRIFLHIESSHEPLFKFLILRAAHSATKIEHTMVSVANEIIPTERPDGQSQRIGEYMNDAALLLNAEFFHKQKHCLDLHYL